MSSSAKAGFKWIAAVALAVTLLQLGGRFAKGEGASEEWKKQADTRLTAVEEKVESIDDTIGDLKTDVGVISNNIEWLVKKQGGTPQKGVSP